MHSSPVRRLAPALLTLLLAAGCVALSDLDAVEPQSAEQDTDAAGDTGEDTAEDTISENNSTPDADAGADAAEDVTEDAVEDVAEDVPSDTAEDAPDDVAPDTPEDAPQDTDADATQDTAEDADAPEDADADDVNDAEDAQDDADADVEDAEDASEDVVDEEDPPEPTPALKRDVNGDGIADAMIAAPLFPAIFHIRGGPISNTYLNNPSSTQVIQAPVSCSGNSVVTHAGDLNGNGYADMVLGCPDGGTVYVYEGAELSDTPTPQATLTGAVGFGQSINTEQDLNGDGYYDLVVAAPPMGAARIYWGSAQGVSTARAEQLTRPATVTATWSWGMALATSPDLTGDGHGEIFISTGQPGQPGGQVYVASSMTPGVLTALVPSGTGMPWGTTLSVITGQNAPGTEVLLVGQGSGAMLYRDWLISQFRSASTEPEPIAGAGHGIAVDAGGDFDGNGLADLLIAGAPDAARIGLHRDLNGQLALELLTFDIPGNPCATMGPRTIAFTGDINDDGKDDFLLGEPSCGNVHIFLGAVINVGMGGEFFSLNLGQSTTQLGWSLGDGRTLPMPQR